MAGVDWTDQENDLIVADYFAMLMDELNGKKFNKAEHNRNLRELLTRRNRSSVEFKHRNISAVLEKMGLPKIKGYLPAPSHQISLIDAVVRWVDARPDWLDPNRPNSEKKSSPDHNRLLTFGRPPSPLPPVSTNEERAALERDQKFVEAVRKRYNPSEKDAQNQALGEAGEKRVLDYEIRRLKRGPQPELASKVKWTSKEEGDGAGYDIASFEDSGKERLIEVKTTNGYERTPFFISPNELKVADHNRDIWHLVRLWDFSGQPRAFSIRPPLASHVSLTPTNYRASLL